MLWEHGVREGRLSMNRLVDITSTTIAKIFGLYPRKGSIAPGFDADIVIFDPSRSFTFGTDTSLMNVDYDVFDGHTVAGSPRTTLSRGTVVYDDGKILTRPGHGRFVKRSLFDEKTHGETPLRETTTAS
jgi:dihydropyrimidinase